MTLPALAGLTELRNRLGVDIDDPIQALALLDYASSLVRAYTRRSFVDDDGNLDAPDGPRQVTVEAVARAVTNPAGVTQDTAGPFTVSYGSDAAQRVYLTRADKAILGPVGRGGLQVLSTTRGHIETRTADLPQSDPPILLNP